MSNMLTYFYKIQMGDISARQVTIKYFSRYLQNMIFKYNSYNLHYDSDRAII